MRRPQPTIWLFDYRRIRFIACAPRETSLAGKKFDDGGRSMVCRNGRLV
jgi:hypothetical protein